METVSQNTVRNLSLDLLKALSCFAVVILHVTGIILKKNYPYSVTYILYYVSCFAVPIFFAVHGHLMLNKTYISYKTIFNKCLRILSIVFLWNFIVFITSFILKGQLSNPFLSSLNSLIQKGYFWQFWFFGSLLIIYTVLPLLKKVSNNLKIFVLLTLTLILISVTIDVVNLLRCFQGSIKSSSNLPQTFRLWTWLAYFCIGGVIGKKKIQEFLAKYFNFPMNLIIMIVSMIVVNIYQYNIGIMYHDFHAEMFYGNIFTFIYVLSLYFLILRLPLKKLHFAVRNLSANIMGIYILHVTIIALFQRVYNFNTPLLNVLLIIIVFFVSYLGAYVLSKIPILNYLVKL